MNEQKEWVKVSDRMPKSGEFVLAYLKNELGKGRRIRAFWAAKHSIESEGDTDWFEYDEATDCSYTPEGWYETNEYDENNWHVHDPVTHWMPLPEPPND